MLIRSYIHNHIWPFEDHHDVDVVLSGHEFDQPDLNIPPKTALEEDKSWSSKLF